LEIEREEEEEAIAEAAMLAESDEGEAFGLGRAEKRRKGCCFGLKFVDGKG